MKLGHLIELRTRQEDADFWITRRGSIKTVGKPSKEYNPESYGVKIKDSAKEVMIPNYLFYIIQHIYTQGYFKQVAVGSTNLVNIKASDILNLPIG